MKILKFLKISIIPLILISIFILYFYYKPSEPVSHCYYASVDYSNLPGYLHCVETLEDIMIGKMIDTAIAKNPNKKVITIYDLGNRPITIRRLRKNVYQITDRYGTYVTEDYLDLLK